MKLFTREEIYKVQKDQARENTRVNDKIIASLKRTLRFSNSVNIDEEKVKKMKEFDLWCENLQNKKSELLKDIQTYRKTLSELKEDLYAVIEKKDSLEDINIDLIEKNENLDLQIKWKEEVLKQQHA